MPLSAEQVVLTFRVVDDLATALMRLGRPLSPAVRDVRRILAAAVLAQSRPGIRQFVSDSSELNENLIGAVEAAALLNMSVRSVQRHAEALGGRLVGRKFVFDRDVILERG
jgi:hypothetical protein